MKTGHVRRLVIELWIHEQDIQEAGRLLILIADALSASVSLSGGPIYVPIYELKLGGRGNKEGVVMMGLFGRSWKLLTGYQLDPHSSRILRSRGRP
jgi:hypothetical protein